LFGFASINLRFIMKCETITVPLSHSTSHRADSYISILGINSNLIMIILYIFVVYRLMKTKIHIKKYS